MQTEKELATRISLEEAELARKREELAILQLQNTAPDDPRLKGPINPYANPRTGLAAQLQTNNDDIPFDDQPTHSESLESLKALDELFLIAGQFTTRAAYADLLLFIARFRMYSPFNAMLVHTQMPGAIYVATPKRWAQHYKRTIHPGARPITILQPKGPVLFVFDVSDTSPLSGAPELPESITNPFAIHNGKENGELDKTIENAKRDGVRVHQREFGSQYGGQIGPINTSDVFILPGPCFNDNPVKIPVRYELSLNSHQSREEQYATLVHELGHLYCGHLGSPNKQYWPDRRGLDRQVEECEAESISYLVCTRLGIETPSEEYLADYLGEGGKMPPISLETVIKMAGLIQRMGQSRLPLRKSSPEE
jgi:hypothetical protein